MPPLRSILPRPRASRTRRHRGLGEGMFPALPRTTLIGGSMTLWDRFARFIMRGWYQKILFTASGLPSPHDEPTVSTPGEDPDMVLLIGNGPAFG